MNYELLKDKYLLLDTNIIIDYSKFPLLFRDFTSKIRSNKITLVADETVRFEFLRNANSLSKRTDLENLFKTLLLSDVALHLNKTTVDDAIYIANIYSWKEKHKIELADCFLASAMRKFNSSSDIPRLYLATQNHKDYPDFMFKRIGIETIDINGDAIINIGFYEFDKERFDKIESEYNKKA